MLTIRFSDIQYSTLKEKYFAFNFVSLEAHVHPLLVDQIISIMKITFNEEIIFKQKKNSYLTFNFFQNHEMLIIAPYFVACSVGYLPSTLRERPVQGKQKLS